MGAVGSGLVQRTNGPLIQTTKAIWKAEVISGLFPLSNGIRAAVPRGTVSTSWSHPRRIRRAGLCTDRMGIRILIRFRKRRRTGHYSGRSRPCRPPCRLRGRLVAWTTVTRHILLTMIPVIIRRCPPPPFGRTVPSLSKIYSRMRCPTGVFFVDFFFALMVVLIHLVRRHDGVILDMYRFFFAVALHVRSTAVIALSMRVKWLYSTFPSHPSPLPSRCPLGETWREYTTPDFHIQARFPLTELAIPSSLCGPNGGRQTHKLD